MALPAHLLQQLPPGVAPARAGQAASFSLPLGLGSVDAALPDGGLPLGAVVELSVHGGAALATRFALAAFRAAQVASRQRGGDGDGAWCAFVDPASSLHAPGVLRAGVSLERLLVVRPPLEALSRTALRLAESRAFAVLAIDTVGVPGASLDVALAQWPRVVRRLALAVQGSSALVLLITDAEAQRALPLPVAQRLQLSRPSPGELALQVVKDRGGRIGPRRIVPWQGVFDSPRGVTPAQREAAHGLRLIG